MGLHLLDYKGTKEYIKACSGRWSDSRSNKLMTISKQFLDDFYLTPYYLLGPTPTTSILMKEGYPKE
jgi:hypothetical protein